MNLARLARFRRGDGAYVRPAYTGVIVANPYETAAKIIGYSSLNGASRTALAALAGYNLITREGNKQRVSDVALRVLRPISEGDKIQGMLDAFRTPAIFAKIHNEHSACSEAVLASILLREGFTEDGAKRAAKIYKENVAFIGDVNAHVEQRDPPSVKGDEGNMVSPPPSRVNIADSPENSKKTLAQYSIPLGANEATLTFSGVSLSADDFDALADFVEFAKKQFLRKEKAQKDTPPVATKVLSRPAVDLRVSLSDHRPGRFTPKQAEEHSVLDMACHEEFVAAWTELIKAGEVVVVSPGDPNIYALKGNA